MHTEFILSSIFLTYEVICYIFFFCAVWLILDKGDLFPKLTGAVLVCSVPPSGNR